MNARVRGMMMGLRLSEEARGGEKTAVERIQLCHGLYTTSVAGPTDDSRARP